MPTLLPLPAPKQQLGSLTPQHACVIPTQEIACLNGHARWTHWMLNELFPNKQIILRAARGFVSGGERR